MNKNIIDLTQTEYQISYYRSAWSIYINELIHFCKFPDIEGREQAMSEFRKMKLDFKKLVKTVVTIKANFENEVDIEELIEKTAYQDAIEVFLENTEISRLSKKFIEENFSRAYESVGRNILRQNESKLEELIVRKSKSFVFEPKEREFVVHCLEPKTMEGFLF